METDGRKIIRELLDQFEKTFGDREGDLTAVSAWRTDEPYMNGVPFLAACSDGVVRIARYDQVLGKTGYWTLDRATIVPNIIAWALIHPYEGVE